MTSKVHAVIGSMADPCPCETCPVFAICKSKTEIRCSILNNYMTSCTVDSNHVFYKLKINELLEAAKFLGFRKHEVNHSTGEVALYFTGHKDPLGRWVV